MEQFSFEKYLDNPSRGLVTRNRRKVKILCVDYNNKMSPTHSILALIRSIDYDLIAFFDINGKCFAHDNGEWDLFFNS